MQRMAHLLASVRAWFFGKEPAEPKAVDDSARMGTLTAPAQVSLDDDARPSNERAQLPEGLRPIGSETIRVLTATALGERRFDNQLAYRHQCWTVEHVEVDVFEARPSCIRIKFPKADPDYPRIGLGVVNSLTDLFPDPCLVKEIVVSDFPHADQYWMRLQHKDPELVLVGEAEPEKDIITLFRPTMGRDLHGTLLHEWSHLHQLADRTASKVFDDVGLLEEFTTGSQSIQTSPAEKWPILSEHWLGEDVVIAFAAAVGNPIRSAVWSKAFEQRLGSLPAELRSSRHEFYVKRGRAIRNGCFENALSTLEDDAKSANPAVKDAAVIVLNYLSPGEATTSDLVP
jgi:hypothetical protein